MNILGIDTSNYTTSLAWLDTERGVIEQQKQLLPVPEGAAGLRQSDAVFHHVRQLPVLFRQLSERVGTALRPDAIGVSVSPRPQEGSYMPCFLAGMAAARMLGDSHGVPVYETSHQTGHILAALYSAGCMDWLNADALPFLAFHVSGGTTDCVRCIPHAEKAVQIEPVSGSLDLKAGQAIDRIGLMLGLKFPCGAALEQLASESTSEQRMRFQLKDGSCSLSGLQNQCETMYRKGAAPSDIARYTLNSVAAVIRAMTEAAAEKTQASSVLYAGGVLSDRLIQNALRRTDLRTAFAEPAFSCDNAAGVAVYAARREGFSCRF
ncbi:MAG: peptidase M22 [Oscillospiraceae bacterium]|nr:peptidase M22 [Oscillospiraceae bacterium]